MVSVPHKTAPGVTCVTLGERGMLSFAVLSILEQLPYVKTKNCMRYVKEKMCHYCQF
jgi:hypothetical protein